MTVRPPAGPPTSSVDLARARAARLLRLLRLLVIGAGAVLALAVYLLVFGLAPQPITTGGALIAAGLGILAAIVLTRRAVVLAIGWRFASRWTLLLPLARLLLRPPRRER